jgi:hypothetical protein
MTTPTLTMQGVELLLDCVTQSRGFKDFEERGIEDLQAIIMEMKSDLERLQRSGIAGASIVVWSTKDPEPREKKVKKKKRLNLIEYCQKIIT